ncbi:2-C-methyl-D-erythritol 2,4-cyclodiphosphate synthase [Fusobacterium ulcerans]|uniref:2-C-methyl-D-erythritol 2,4-cyclodiphosphate synthase n=3 Tax=Fusobacteriaceae TaxID=203492 RepID=A0AAX1TMI6_9FUSO|nr:2-C-methyl-D-erythritol 2,4-cyclodiphosphate synthase [Fusobacterium ulcerans]EFS26846.2 2-C-methyl-D-erythritol 2,4-cyclodiphosphate synthase [Fusobacterium ulcerans ATCC 49185]EHO79024.1 2-C-methyl-D-erythritol 2,4-cyclodiphosphate synthase [Fusobacterium ulcerans 12-1B]MDH6459715.1 2-C-methyl-D-erythritol 2,4-cyclodiphosphate synthase [Fusobacterium sp. PH5-7]RGY60056.1 2-C-methyl-D-erythritol 2,4-cyclodiphosphate synthase [Fusobacterium ulcerans]
MKYLNSIIEFMRDGNSDIMIRIGNGYDVHVLTEGRKLVLGGVEIPHTKGVLGHSDGDVLVHAVMDAMLGALALGDIGKHFPDTDMKYENIDSTILLKRVKELIAERGYKIINLDSIIVLQKPKVKPYIEAMRKRIAEVLEIDVEQVSVKATTEEKLGFTGDESGVKSYCVVLLEK